MILLFVFMQLPRDLFAIAKFLFSLFLLWIKSNNRLWVEYNKNNQLKQHNDWMHKCLPRDAIHSA